ncbi:protein of unknown function [Caballeronia sp. S22]
MSQEPGREMRETVIALAIAYLSWRRVPDSLSESNSHNGRNGLSRNFLNEANLSSQGHFDGRRDPGTGCRRGPASRVSGRADRLGRR